MHVTAPLVIVEGNWLLLDDESGASLRNFVISRSLSTRQLLVAGTTGRAQAGGRGIAGRRRAFYDRTDGPNVRRVLEESLLQI